MSTSKTDPATSEDVVIVTRANGVARIELNAPKSLNALSEAMMAALQSSLDALSSQRDVRAIVIGSTGAQFCAGHNLKEMTARRQDDDGGDAYFNQLFATCSRLMTSIVRQPQPVIAEVQGVATAAGCQLVAACDLAVAGESARFATSGVNIGLFCSTPMVALARNVGRKHAMEMLLSGEFISAQRAAEMGLINRVVSDAQVRDAAHALADVIAAKSSAAVKIGKRAFYDQAEMSLDDAYAFAGRVMAENMMTRDAEAGIGAFITKQPHPPWRGS